MPVSKSPTCMHSSLNQHLCVNNTQPDSSCLSNASTEIRFNHIVDHAVHDVRHTRELSKLNELHFSSASRRGKNKPSFHLVRQFSFVNLKVVDDSRRRSFDVVPSSVDNFLYPSDNYIPVTGNQGPGEKEVVVFFDLF